MRSAASNCWDRVRLRATSRADLGFVVLGFNGVTCGEVFCLYLPCSCFPRIPGFVHCAWGWRGVDGVNIVYYYYTGIRTFWGFLGDVYFCSWACGQGITGCVQRGREVAGRMVPRRFLYTPLPGALVFSFVLCMAQKSDRRALFRITSELIIILPQGVLGDASPIVSVGIDGVGLPCQSVIRYAIRNQQVF